MNILAIDIGNTNISFGVIDGDQTRQIWRISTLVDRTDDEYVLFLDFHLRQHNLKISEIKDAVVCSVVPAIVPALSAALQKLLKKKPIIIGRDLKAKITIDIKNLNELGMDRIVNSYAAYKLYNSPCIIVDFGTATTFDIVSEKGHYSGGIICPGIKISLEALSQKTAQLPKISPVRPQSLIGKNTVESILSGSYYGYIDMVSGLIDRSKLEMAGIMDCPQSEIKVIATGGFSKELHGSINKFDAILVDLTMRGIYFVYVN